MLPGKIRDTGSPMVKLPAESDVLAGHVIEGCRCVPSFVGMAGLLRKIRRSLSRGSAVDRRQQHKIAAGVVDLATTKCEAVKIFVKPQAVIEHEAQEILLGPHDALARDHMHRIAGTADATAMFTSHIAGKREGGLIKKFRGIVVVLVLNAVVGVISDPAWNS